LHSLPERISGSADKSRSTSFPSMDPRRVGTTFRSVRIKKRLRQRDVAERCQVSRTTVSRLERGALGGLTIDKVMAIAEELGIRVDVVARWQGGDLDRLLNSGHSALHEAVARMFGVLDGWAIAPEVSFSVYGERGVIDLLCWHADTRALLVIELKTEIVDIQDLMATVDRKKRLAAKIGSERGWPPASVSSWVIVADGRTNRRRVHSHAATLRAAFPADGRSVPSWLREPSGTIAALSFWSNAREAGVKGGLAARKRVRRPTSKAA
jgi:transcriptional regulator with XRE-family HTH domain